VDVRPEQTKEPCDRLVREHDHVVNGFQGADQLRSIGGGENRVASPLERLDRPVVVDRNDEPVCLRPGGLKISHVTDVQQIETAVRQSDRPPRRTVAADRVDEFTLREQLGHHYQHWRWGPTPSAN
jgi:hypothetical protein